MLQLYLLSIRLVSVNVKNFSIPEDKINKERREIGAKGAKGAIDHQQWKFLRTNCYIDHL